MTKLLLLTLIFALLKPYYCQITMTFGSNPNNEVLSNGQIIFYAIGRTLFLFLINTKAIVYEIGILSHIYRKFLIKCLENVHI